MPAIRGKRKTGAVPASKSAKKTLKTKDIRKSLSVLQPAADNPASLVGSGGSSTSQKIKKQKPLLDCKENSPMKPRRSKRRPPVSNCEKLEVKSSTPISNDAKSTKASSMKQRTLKEYSEKLNEKLKENDLVNQQEKLKENDLVNQQEDQKEFLEHSKASLSGVSIPSESSGYFSDCAEKPDGSFKSDVLAENKSITESADADEGLPKMDVCAPPTEVVQNTPSAPEDVYDMLTRDKVPQCYWEEVAEQRRLALEEALRENESLRDQVEVMETLNAGLRSQVNDAEKLAEAVKNILGDS